MKHTIILPDLGQTTSEAKVVRWLKKPGDKLSNGESLLEVETDKATMEVEAYVGGYLRETLVEEGEVVSAMAPIAILTDRLDESYPEALSSPSAQPATPPPRRPEPTPAKTSPAPVAAVPAARSLAKEVGIELSSVVGTGPGGLITKNDVERIVAERPTSKLAPPASQPEFKPLSAMASLTTSSKSTIPHFYVSRDVDLSAAEVWRNNWNDSHPDLKASINEVFVRAASRALLESPRLNVSYQNGKYEQRSNGDVLLVIAVDSVLKLTSFANAQALSWDEYLRRMRTTLGGVRRERMVASPAETGEEHTPSTPSPGLPGTVPVPRGFSSLQPSSPVGAREITEPLTPSPPVRGEGHPPIIPLLQGGNTGGSLPVPSGSAKGAGVGSPDEGEIAAKNLTQTHPSTNSKNPTPLLAISNLGMFGVREFAAIIPPGCTSVLAVGAVREKVILKDKQPEVIKVCSLTLSADHRVVDGIAAAKFMERMQVHLNSL
jgi:pyruvate/2-oxoglutarate dehydrogenase complex dihydrolipoamide acyltransferase (E2) component